MAELTTDSSEPLDATSFSAVDYVNSLFPNEQSLANVDIVLRRLQTKVRSTDAAIVDAVRDQTTAGRKGLTDLGEAKNAIASLASQISSIGTKAAASETMVADLTRDIKSLDSAKNALKEASDTLASMKALTLNLQALEEATNDKDYATAGEVLVNVNAGLEHFGAFPDNPRIKELSEKASSCKRRLRLALLADYKILTQDPVPARQLPELLAGSTVVDQLDTDGTVREEVIQWFCSEVMLPDYEANFALGVGGEEGAGRLESTDRRYAWLKRNLKHYSETFSGAFPETWNVPEAFSIAFCQKTREHLIAELDEGGSSVDVAVLLRVITLTKEFEKELNRRFAVREDGTAIGADSDEDDVVGSDEERVGALKRGPTLADDTGADAIKAKYREFQRARRREAKAKAAAAGRGSEGGKRGRVSIEGPKPSTKFTALISECFTPFMHLYVAEEDRNLGDALKLIQTEETWFVEDGDNMILSSAGQLIMALNKVIRRASTFSRGKPLYDMYRLFHKYMGLYAQFLTGRLPANALPVKVDDGDVGEDGEGGGGGGSSKYPVAVLGTTDWIVKETSPDEQRVRTLILNTANYTSRQVGSFADAFKRMVDPAFIENVDVTPIEDAFDELVTASVNSIVLSLETSVEPQLLAMTKMPWGSWESVGVESSYVEEIGRSFAEVMPVIARTATEVKLFHHVCSQLVKSLIPRYQAAIFKCKRISEVGANQILVDIAVLKDNILLKIPAAGDLTGTRKKPPGSFTKYVIAAMAKAEAILKVIQVPAEAVVARYRTVIPESAQSSADLQRLLELKGVKKSEQNGIIDEFLADAPEDVAQRSLGSAGGSGTSGGSKGGSGGKDGSGSGDSSRRPFPRFTSDKDLLRNVNLKKLFSFKRGGGSEDKK